MNEHRNEDIEELIRESPDDEQRYLTYADWLQQQGDPRGELITVQHLLAQKKLPTTERVIKDRPIAARAELEARERELLEEHDHLSFDVEGIEAQWSLGFIETAKLELDTVDEWRDALTALFAHPSARLLRKLVVSSYEATAPFDEAVTSLATEHELPETLRRLHVGDFDVPEWDPEFSGPFDDWPQYTTLPALFEAMPQLRALRLRGVFPEFVAWPRALVSLCLETVSLPPPQLNAIARIERPALKRLELWFGETLIQPEELAPIIAGKVGQLRQLGLENAGFTDALVAPLARSPILKRLKSLSFAHGTMTDAGARTLVENASWYDDVHTLDVSGNFITPAVLDRVTAVCPRVIVGDQREEEWGVAPEFIPSGSSWGAE